MIYGKRGRNQMKYYSLAPFHSGRKDILGTLLNTTKMTVWKNIVPSIPIAFGSLNPAKATSVVWGRKEVRG
jgi:hypothetical protein